MVLLLSLVILVILQLSLLSLLLLLRTVVQAVRVVSSERDGMQQGSAATTRSDGWFRCVLPLQWHANDKH
jgi:hypothetical protein